jgi:hypothetical protein
VSGSLLPTVPPCTPSSETSGVGHYTLGNTFVGSGVELFVMTSTYRTPELHHQFTPTQTKGGRTMILFRQELGDVLRDARRSQGRTLRQVSSDARVSLGYLSEIERGQKEASSELLVSVTDALGLPLSFVLREVSERIAIAEQVTIPDTVPEGLADGAAPLVGAR